MDSPNLIEDNVSYYLQKFVKDESYKTCSNIFCCFKILE